MIGVCAKIGCGKIGRYRPVLLIRVHTQHEPAEGHMGLVLCREHGQEAERDVSTLIGDDAWDDLCQGIERMGGTRPNRDLLTVHLQEVS